MTTYLDNLTRAMTLLGSSPDAVFLGQAVVAPGTAMTPTFTGVPPERLVEFPVAEDAQLGVAIGLSLTGHHPVVAVYPRINFLLLAMNQLVLHLDALEYHPRVIIRTAVASSVPLDPGRQHLGDYSSVLEAALRTVVVERLTIPEQVLPAYRAALARPESTIVVEYAELYGMTD